MHAQILQKCDAKRPCTTCTNCGGESGCFYDESRTPHVNPQPLSNTARSFPLSDEDVPGPSSDGPSSQLLLDTPEEVADSSGTSGLQIGSPTRMSSDAPSSSSTDPVGWDLAKLPSLSHPFQGSGSFDPRGTERDLRSEPRRPTNPPSPPSASMRLSVLPSLRLSIIPRPIHTPLSFFPPENFQVTGTTPGTLEMSLYVLLAPRFVR